MFDMWQRSPVFHLPPAEFDRAWLKDDLGDGRQRGRLVTRCGLTIYESTWGAAPHRDIDYATRLRRDHAEKIGRLCRRCEMAA